MPATTTAPAPTAPALEALLNGKGAKVHAGIVTTGLGPSLLCDGMGSAAPHRTTAHTIDDVNCRRCLRAIAAL